MQVFGKYTTNFDMDYLVEHYIYMNESEDEKITVADVKTMLKKKRKTVAGTIFLFNPETSPIGYKMSKFLQEDGFDKYNEIVALNEDPKAYILNAGLKQHFKGKLVEIKYLFTYNRENIEPTPIMEEFDADLDKYNSNQFTRYDKELNYINISDIRLSGKFVFMGMGHKYDRHHKSIITYTRAISTQIQKLDKNIVFMYDNNYDIDECIDRAYFLSPYAGGKARELRANGFKEVFKTNPPQSKKLTF